MMANLYSRIQDDHYAIWLRYDEGYPDANMHAMIRCGPNYNEGVGIVLSATMLVELRDAIQGILDAMGVQEGEE